MLSPADIVFLLDVDNTLLDNDRFGADLGAKLEQSFGGAERDRYWSIYAALRDELGYADYLGTLQRFRNGIAEEPMLLQMSAFVLDYPFAERLYPRAVQAIAHLRRLGRAVVFSDGDIVFQPRKIQRSGIWDAVGGDVLVTVHKQLALPAMQQRFPARRYVMVDDKPMLLAAMKRTLGERLGTVFVRQGHYARESAGAAIDPQPDLTIDAIGDLLGTRFADFLHGRAGTTVAAQRGEA
jgi:FMN phosphatase YigB (HAD superfamily)